jgi:hypothetical protein
MPPAVLAEIGGSTPAAEDGRGTIIIGKAAGLETGAIIVPKADRVGQPIRESVGAIIPAGLDQTRRENGGAEQGGGKKPLHLVSPKMSRK